MEKEIKRRQREYPGKEIIIGAVIITIGFLVTILFFSDSYALDDFGTASIKCTSDKMKSGSTMTCSIKGSLASGKKISCLSAKLSFSNNLVFKNFTNGSVWNQDENDMNIDLYSDADIEGNFDIGTFKIESNENILNSDETISLTNVYFYDENFLEYKISDVSLNVKVYTDYVTFSDNLTVNESKKIINNLNINSSYSSIISSIDTNGTITVKDKNQSILANNSVVKTGDIINIALEEETKQYKVSVLGDVVGNGAIAINDVAKSYSYLKGKTSMTDEYIMAADVTHDRVIKINDVAKLYGYVKGKVTNLN